MDESTVSPGEAQGKDGLPESEEKWQEMARAFSQARMRLYGLQTAAGLLFPLLFWYFGGSRWLAATLAASIEHFWLLALAFVLAYQIIASLLFLPFSHYGGFVLQHRFGLSRQKLPGWLSDWAKATAIGSFFFLAGMEAFYVALVALPGNWWWVLAIGLSLVALLLTYVAPVLLLPIFYKCSPLEDRELVERVRALAERVGARVSRVCTIDMSRRTVAANAALTGIGRTRQVLLGDTMLQQFTRDEVETVLAHEFGHHVHGDIWKGLGLEVAAAWAGLFLLQYAVRPAFLHAGLEDISSLANLPLLMLLGDVATVAVMPAFGAVSRRYEAQADAFAARVSNMPEAYSAALYRLAKQNLAELWPPRWMELVFYTHPAIGRRMRSVHEASSKSRSST